MPKIRFVLRAKYVSNEKWGHVSRETGPWQNGGKEFWHDNGSRKGDSHPMDIEILANKFYEHSKYIRGYSEQTIRRYRQSIGQYSRFAGTRLIADASAKSVREFLMHGRVQRNWTANTFIVYHKSLSVFFKWCAENGYLPDNPADGIEMPKLDKKLPSKLRKEDALRLLEVAYNYPYDYTFLKYRNHAIFSTFIHAGLRKSELLGLALSDVDLQNLTILVRRGKGAKDRIIPMSHALAQSLARYLDDRKRLKKTCPEFFTSLYHNSGLTGTGMKLLVKTMRKASRIHFTAHKLRHTFATLMLEGGCDIYSLSRMMGHSDIKTTTIYLAASAEHLRAQMMKHPLND